MKNRRSLPIIALALAAGSAAGGLHGQVTSSAPAGRPAAIIDLRTAEGARLVSGRWRYSDARIIEVDHRAVGADLKPSGPPSRTHDVFPRAGAADFDDSSWEAIEPESLESRRSTGKLCFNWYRIRVRIPERVGKFDPAGSTVIFEVVVDDYAEVWVNGKLPLVLGQAGGAVAGGWNAPNRVVLGTGVRPGQEFQIAVFGANGPLSDPPGNFIWLRSATLDFHRPEDAGTARAVNGEVVRLDPALDAIIGPAPRFERLADRFQFTEGPVWVPDGYLLFSDPNANRIYRYSPDGQVSIFRTKSGYAGIDVGDYGQPGSNGLALDGQGRLTICEHGNRRVSRLEKNGVLTVLADRHEGKRLNSPNDLVYRSDGALYFTDPPFGLPRFHDDPRKELPFSGVFCLRVGTLAVVSTDLLGPNGLAFSPDEKYLYVDNWDVKKKVVMRYEVRPDGTLAGGTVFFDMAGAPGEEALDGLKVDRQGNLYVSGPGGVWVISPAAKHLGTLRLPELPANFAWGDEDGRTLYFTARTGLYRLRLNIPGTRSQVASAATR
jgi:gluconolactonase